MNSKLASEYTVFDQTPCSLGEGPLWHPLREQFFWFDINACRLYAQSSAKGAIAQQWSFDGHVSAAGWIDHDHLMVAHEKGLLKFHIDTGHYEVILELESDNPITRSNDGRADPWGGFWIGTMGKNLETHAGAIYRYYRGEVRKLFAPWTVPNAQCFSPDGGFAYFTDTPRGQLLRQRLDPVHGWPMDDFEVLMDLPASDFRPDGAVVDADGDLWIAHYGHAKITRHLSDGTQCGQINLPTDCITCPSFGGAQRDILLATSAAQSLNTEQLMAQPDAGKTFRIDIGVKGQTEHQVII